MTSSAPAWGSETTPSAPGLWNNNTTDAGTPSGSGSLWHGLSPAAPRPKCDSALYHELLRSSNGDHSLVATRLADMGFSPADYAEQQQQQQSIKAVGGGASGMAAHWAHTLPTKESLKRSPGPRPPNGERDLDGQAAEAGAPSHFFCPISLQLMRDPVMMPTGQSYDRPCIERWLAAGNRSCPATGVTLKPPVALVPNVALRGAIEEWSSKHAPWLLDQHSRVKPIPKDEQFAALPAAGLQGQSSNPDLNFAIRLQQEELQRLASQRAAMAAGPGAGAGAAAGGVAAFGVQAANGSRRGSGAPAGGGSPYYVQPPQRRRRGMRSYWSPTTGVLLAATAAYISLFIVSVALDGWNIENLALNPWAGSSLSALMSVGAQDAAAVTTGGQWWRLFTSPFVNGGVIQLLLNTSCLWTFGRYLEATMLPHPAPAIAATYLLGAWAGALASANLNLYYITCGASSGVCALLGAVWADQLVNRRKYVRHALTVAVLAIITALLITMSLLPLLDPWYQAAALLTGFFTGTALLLAPRVVRRARRHRGAAVLSAHCLLLVVGGLVVAAVGVGINARVAAGSGFFKDSCCVGFGNWQCVPTGGSPDGCLIEAAQNGTRVLYCASGESYPLPAGTSVPAGNTALVTQICTQYCTTASGGAGGDSGAASGGTPPADEGAAAEPGAGGPGTGSGGTASPSPSPPPGATAAPIGSGDGSDGVLL
ncbi:hypothetical protein D9Q98_005294 [Chlorella vulgaris]|uniref:RHOMBOID-like protein n=1 Tax=Chlorella vulgaris TaxID=3077 RepID=A0A9D4YWU1_CHLVU|nr:hypothetical protein D9Q98_005294 [Chlorella vulgaris]